MMSFFQYILEEKKKIELYFLSDYLSEFACAGHSSVSSEINS